MRESESDGTIKYFSLAFPIIDALENGERLIVDEFGAKLHTLLIERIVSMFNSEKANKNKGIHFDLRAYDELEEDGTGRNVKVYDYGLTAIIPLMVKTFFEEQGQGLSSPGL